jgi:hypothetical protein
MSLVIDEVHVNHYIGLCECGMQYEVDFKWVDTLPEDER